MKYLKIYFFGAIMFMLGAVHAANVGPLIETTYEPHWYKVWTSLAFAVVYPALWAGGMKE